MNKIIIALLMLVGVCFGANAQRYQRYIPSENTHMFGVCFSAMDSTVYFTEIKYVPNTSIERGTGFLYSRNEYSGQLQSYIKSAAGGSYSTVTVYSQSAKKLEKKYTKMREKYQKRKFVVKYIDSGFNYTPIPYVAPTVGDEK